MAAAGVGYVAGGWTVRLDMANFMTTPITWIAALLSFASMSGLLMNLVWRMNRQQHALIAEQHRIAFHDALTGLANRRLLEDRLRHAFYASRRSQHEGALLFIDLDHFKTLNDTLGHNVGDMLLCEVAQRIKSCVRKSDTVSRFGGDEFIVLLENIDPQFAPTAVLAGQVAEKILNSVLQPYELERHRHQISASIGVALFPEDEKTLEDLMRHADIAMYQSKQAGRNTIRFFDPSMQQIIESRARIEKWLDKALTENQFSLHYQLQIHQDGRIVGAEVLLRWTHPERGSISPGEFIPVAEETGQIAQIGQWALEDACRRIKSWENHPQLSEIQLAVNVSGRQVQQADFVARIAAVVERHAINPRRLKLEITESLMQGDIADIIDKMQRIRELGISFSMDDFGTGYSSLSRLKRLPIDQLKIDRSFVDDIERDNEDVAIVQTIIAMSRALGLEVIAEGIETEAQRDFLVRLGCLHFQGYLFGKPIPAEQFEKLIIEHATPRHTPETTH
jgi:diguanylate cyclase (GGDEF)-like protein